MRAPPVIEEVFREGAEAMRGKIVAVLMVQPISIDIITRVLTLPPPPFTLAERMDIRKEPDDGR